MRLEKRFAEVIFDVIEQREHRYLGAIQDGRVVLGGTAGSAGGSGEPPAGFWGQLAQSNITYDTDAIRACATRTAGSNSLVDNLDRIRLGDEICNDAIQERHIDWGTGGSQVSAVDMPFATTSGSIVATNVRDAIEEARGSGGGIVDHGLLEGLADDDHTQYLLADGTRALTGAWDVGAQVVTFGAGITFNGTAQFNASVGVGRAPGAGIGIWLDVLASNGYSYGCIGRMTADGAGADATAYLGYLGGIVVRGAGNLTAVSGQSALIGQVRHLTASVVTRTQAVTGDIRFEGAAATGSFTTAMDFWVKLPVRTGGAVGTIGTFYGIYGGDLTGTGFITTPYFIYSEGGNSYHAGRFAIGGTVGALGQAHIDQSNPTGVIPTLLLDQADLSEEFIEFTTTVGAGNPIDTAALGAYYGKVRVNVTGVGYKVLALYEES